MGYRLKALREEKRLTQEELAEKSGVSRVTIAMIEAGSKDNVMSKTLLSLAQALEVSVAQLFL